MTNVHYITDAEGKKTAVILPIENYEKVLKENDNENSSITKTSDFEYLRKFLTRQLVLSLLDKAFEFLKIPIDNSSRRKRDSSLLLFALVEHFYYSKTTQVDKENYKVTLMDDELYRFHVGIERKTIQTQRNENLIPYLESSKKSVVEIYQYEPFRKIGTSYKLNFLGMLENACSEFLKTSNLEIRELIDIIELSKTIELKDIDTTNKKFKHLWQIVTRYLNKLPDEPKIHQSKAARASKDKNLQRSY
jgi:hypothetical protein